jgi:hypothetical protein
LGVLLLSLMLSLLLSLLSVVLASACSLAALTVDRITRRDAIVGLLIRGVEG